MPNEGTNSGSQRLRACDACRRRKVRCNGQQRCQQCNHLNLVCVYSANTKGLSRKNAAQRGTIIDSCRTNATGTPTPTGTVTSSTSSSSLSLGSIAPIHQPYSTIHIHPDPSFFTSLLPEYMSSVYPVNPVITESEVRHCIERIGSDRDGTSFLYAYAAVTINLSRIDTVQFAPDIREQIGDLLTKSFEHRDQLGLNERPTLLRVMSSLFIEICLMGLHKKDLAFTYLRETISLLYMLEVDKPEVMSSLPPHERGRIERAFWECFIHERFSALTEFKPICLSPLHTPPTADPLLPPSLDLGWRLLIQTFSLVDREFVDLWLGDRSQVTSEFIERKHQQLDEWRWEIEVPTLSPMQKADLIITRQWLRTVTWQMAISNIRLPAENQSESLSLSLPLRLSSELRQFLAHMSHKAVGIHGSGILNKLFEITNTIADVVIHLPQASTNDTLQRVDDILALKRFLFSFDRIEKIHKIIMMEKMEKMKQVYPAMAEIDKLVNSPIML
ncbi:hypothetical protein VE03_01233 [Pseudogymnoascus sp. 23342-1-I1]|nr:hypothetical protein VE03_01233 [Pseudogymnoascus sp. 23342-1-I1]